MPIPKLGNVRRAQKLELLAGIPLFASCSRRELSLLAALTVDRELPAGAVLTREGQAGGVAYIIAWGQAEVLRSGRRLGRVGPGDVVGELSLIDGLPRSATVQALTDLRVLAIDGRDLRRLLRRSPRIVRKLLEALAGRVRQVDARTRL